MTYTSFIGRAPIAEMNNELAGMAESVGYDVCDGGERGSVGGILFVNGKRQIDCRTKDEFTPIKKNQLVIKF